MAYRKHSKASAKARKSGTTTACCTPRTKPGPWRSTQKAIPELALPSSLSIHSIPTPLPDPTPTTPPATTMSQTAQKAYTRKRKTWGMQVWPESHRMAASLARGHRALSEPLPETHAHHPSPLIRVTSWVGPWGEVIQSTSDLVERKYAVAP